MSARRHAQVSSTLSLWVPRAVCLRVCIRSSYSVIYINNNVLLLGELTGYMVTARWQRDVNETGTFIVLDPGTLLPGIRRAVHEDIFRHARACNITLNNSNFNYNKY